MKRASLAALAACAFFAVRATNVDPPRRSATLAIVADGRLVTANEDSNSISVLGSGPVAEIAVCEQPRTVAVEGQRAFVPCGDGRIARVDLESGRVEVMAEAGIEPFGVIVYGGRLYVSDHGGSAVRVHDAGTLATLATIPTESYPRGLALDPATRTLYVTHFRTGRISAIDIDSPDVVNVLTTGADANLSQSITLFNGRAYLPQTRSNVANRALLFDNTVFPVVTVVDLDSGAVLPRERVSLDIVDQPVNMPFDAVITSQGKMYVVHAGSDDVSAITLDFQQTVAHIDAGFNPRAVVLDAEERFVYVHNALSGTVTKIDVETDRVVETLEATKIPLAPSLLRGKILFNSSSAAALAKDEWISCATCHFDGGADGRTWFFRDGIRNTPALFGIASTLPMHWSGDLDELQDVESTIRTVQAGTGLAAGDVHCSPACDEPRRNARRSQDLDDLAAFMTTLRAPRRRVTPAPRGEALFATHCSSCHPAPFFTDRTKHDVGTGSAFERKGNAFDTPSLRGAFDTAPYLHDGSAATIAEAITRHTNVSAAEAEELAAFVEAIPFPQPRRRAIR
jgi:YVTN family beta-propeller protein